MEMERKVFEAEIKESDEKDLTVVHFISTEKRDRGNDVLHADGMKMEGRPVVMLQHGWNLEVGSEPVAKNIWIRKGDFKNRKGIIAKTQFYPDELGQRLWKKNVEGYMPNWSVGWMPLKYEFVDEHGVEVRHVYQWELLEYSLVSVPMQPDAQTLGGGKSEEVLCFKVLTKVEEDRGELIGVRNDDGTWEMKPYPNEHACRLEDPDKYVRVRRQNNKFGDGIHAIWGVQGGNKPVELQAIRFSKDKHTVAEARAWLKDHKYKCKEFEPASEKCEVCGEVMAVVWDQDVLGDKCGLTCEAGFKYVCRIDHSLDEKAEKFRCQCIDCGHTLESEKHCNTIKCPKCGGKMRRAERPGPGQKDSEEDADSEGKEEKGAIAYKKTPLAAEDEKWSASDEVKKAEVKDLKIMCTWFDSEDVKNKTAYKLPHHKAGGEYVCVWNAVKACAAVIMGARGGADIPDADMGKVKSHIAKHYKDHDKGDAPWEKNDGKIFMLFLNAHKRGIEMVSVPEISDDTGNELVLRDCPTKTEEDIFELAKKYIPELAEFFEPESKTEDEHDHQPEKFDAEAFLKTIESKIKEISDSIMVEITKINSRLDELSVKPGTEGEGDGKIDNSPEPRKIVVVNSNEERKRAEDEKKLALEEIGKQISSQVSEAIKRIVPEAVHDEFDRLRGRVK